MSDLGLISGDDLIMQAVQDGNLHGLLRGMRGWENEEEEDDA